MASSWAVRPSLAAILQPSSIATSSSTAAAVANIIPRQNRQYEHRHQTSLFSTHSPFLKRHTYEGARKTRDNSKHRGESTVRRTGPRWRLSVSDDPLPRPVAREDLPAVETDPDHGLWDFFYDKQRIVNTPAKDSEHGRAWTVEELRAKSWDDLHKLWWVCVKERNRISTASWEREKSELGFGDAEAAGRDRVVRQTMRAIKHTLVERFYLWEDATKLAKNDPEIDLSGDGSAFTPMEYLEEEESSSTVGASGEEVGQDKEKAADTATKTSAIDPSAVPADGQTQRDPARV